MPQPEYEVIKPGDEIPEPDFTYTVKNEGTGDKEEAFYASMFLILLAGLYTEYRDKSPEYILKNADKDLENLFKKFDGKLEKLDELYKTQTGKTLLEAGILPENLEKAKVEYTIKHGKLEQKSTVRSIVHELKQGIISKAHYYLNRGIKSLFNVKSNFRQASSRLKHTLENGFRSTIQKAKRAAKVFLYGDPLAYWVTMHDGRVCAYCMALERDSPMRLSQMPYEPLHLRCRCEVVLEKDLDLTEEAMKLSYYEYER